MTVYALCAAIAQYPVNLPGVPGAESDAAQLHRRLQARGVQSTLLTHSRATASRFLEALHAIIKQSNEGDRVIVYFAGHGGQLPQSSDLEANGSLPEFLAFYEGTLSDIQLAHVLVELRRRHVLLLLDACHSGGMTDLKRLEKARVSDAPDEERAQGTVQVFAAAAEGSLASGATTGGHFTKALLSVIDDMSQVLSHEEFFARIRAVIAQGAPKPVHLVTYAQAAALPVPFGVALPVLNDAEIQAHTLRGFPQHHRTALLFFRIVNIEKFKAALPKLSPTSVAAYAAQPKHAHGLAFTYAGLRALGAQGLDELSEYSKALATKATYAGSKGYSPSYAGYGTFLENPLSRLAAFTVGMGARSVVPLGDPFSGEGAFANWKIKSTRAAPLHGLIIAGGTSDTLEDNVKALKAALGDSVVIHEQVGHRERKEHFGFKDGVSVPGVAGVLQSNVGKAPGSGFTPENATSVHDPSTLLVTESPGIPAPRWALNGSFLAYRRLNQDVPRFKKACAAQVPRWGDRPEDAGARVVGRRQDGSSLEDTRLPEDLDAFDYQAGRCPAYAHAYRCNPRGAYGAPPLFRRGFLFGSEWDEALPDAGEERGIHFLCYQASIEGQFEVVSRWMNDVDHPRPATGVDALVGSGAGKQGRRYDSGAVSLESFVHPSGGEYFFAPSLAGLQQLADGALP